MEPSLARHHLNAELSELRQRRLTAQKQLDQAALDIGVRASYLRDNLGQSKAKSAEIAGVSPGHLTDWMTKAADANTTLDDPLQLIPWLKGAELQSFVARHGGIARIVAGFEDTDVYMRSGIDPTRLLHAGYGGHLRKPHMIIACVDGEITAVDNVQVGYGGTGPSNAIGELTGLGLSDDDAQRIAWSRFSDTHFTDTLSVERQFNSKWAQDDTGGVSPYGDGFIAVVSLDGYTAPAAHTAITTAGREAADDPPPRRTRLRAWLDLLASPDCPAWIGSPSTRRVRIYLDRDAAALDGFASRDWRLQPYPLIIEQGALQLWVSFPALRDTAQRYPAELYQLLAELGFYTAADTLEPNSHRPAFVRWLANRGRVAPPYVDLDDRELTRIHTLPDDERWKLRRF